MDLVDYCCFFVAVVAVALNVLVLSLARSLLKRTADPVHLFVSGVVLADVLFGTYVRISDGLHDIGPT